MRSSREMRIWKIWNHELILIEKTQFRILSEKSKGLVHHPQQCHPCCRCATVRLHRLSNRIVEKAGKESLLFPLDDSILSVSILIPSAGFSRMWLIGAPSLFWNARIIVGKAVLL